MIYDGKTYRNLESQVGYLTDVAEQLDARITEVAANIPSKMIVEELPETGDPNITYYVGPKGTEPNLYYEVWVWVQEEEEGPFVWRELEDTDQVDLSGYLPIQDGVTTYPQVYGKDTDGTQSMVEYSSSVRNAAIVQRNGAGQVAVPNTPTDDSHATSKKYVDDTFVAKATGATTNAQAYVKAPDGTQARYDISVVPAAYTVVYRDNYSCVQTGTPTQNDQAVPKGYADDTYLAKQTGSSSYGQVYGKTTSGTQTMWNVNGNPVSDSIPLRFAYGHIKLPNETTYPPTDDDYAVSKRYVDQVVGQLLYLHEIEILYTISQSTTLKIVANLINGSPTPITSISSADFVRMNVQYGALIEPEGSPSLTPVSVVKHPSRFIYSSTDNPAPGYAYTIDNSGSAIVNFTNENMSYTVTDTVISW